MISGYKSAPLNELIDYDERGLGPFLKYKIRKIISYVDEKFRKPNYERPHPLK